MVSRADQTPLRTGESTARTRRSGSRGGDSASFRNAVTDWESQLAGKSKAADKNLTAPSRNPFSGTPTVAAPVFTAPAIAPPPAMSNRPDTASTITSIDAVIANSARSVQATNAKYNEQAYESYNKAVSEWQQNNGRRWIGGNVFAQTTEPPPMPKYLPTNFNEIYADMAANYQTPRPPEAFTANRPYYMGGSVFFEPKVS